METGLLSRFSALQGLRKRLLDVFEVVNRVGAPLATICASVALRTQIARSKAPPAPFTTAAAVRASLAPLPAHHRDSIHGPGTSAAVNAGRDEDKAARGLASAASITDVSLREPMLPAHLAAPALLVRELLTEVSHDVSQLSSRDETVAVLVEHSLSAPSRSS